MRSLLIIPAIALLLFGMAAPGWADCSCADWKNTDNYNLTLGQTYMDPQGRIAITVHEAGEVEVTNPFVERDLREKGHKALRFLVTIRNATDYLIDVAYINFWVEDDSGHKFAAEPLVIEGQFDGTKIRPGTQRRGYVTVPVPEHLDLGDIVFVYDMGAVPVDFSNPFIRNSEYAVYRFPQE